MRIRVRRMGGTGTSPIAPVRKALEAAAEAVPIRARLTNLRARDRAAIAVLGPLIIVCTLRGDVLLATVISVTGVAARLLLRQ